MMFKLFLNKTTGATVLPLLLSTALYAQALTAERWQAFNEAAISQHITPKYRQLANQSSLLEQYISGYCRQRSEASLAAAKSQFKLAQQAWQQIQHIQFGPVTMLMRNFSLQYWPDKKNLGGRQLNTLLKDAQQSATVQSYDSDFFAAASVAVKGYPALERMLFDQKLILQLPGNLSYCPLMQAIASHISANTAAIVSEWKMELTNYRQYSEERTYESSMDAATEILKALVEPVEAISDAKIAVPLGSELAKMRWRKSESWRSGQSLENIRSNLTALQHLYSGVALASTKALLIETGSAELAEIIDRQFSALLLQLQAIAEPRNMQYEQRQFSQLAQVQQQLKQLSDNLLASMKVLQINLGFNRRDGD
ncbi:MAG: imelysin family protein [Pseudomonadales bacterium]|nr:imelysin family protein [Pseudomonadales bacterium]